ncbi:MAG TPA: dTDP-4-dehydrorhamnose 3,5-epimerase [Terracidiphilus sp.]|jgi:dTDP-4-dehydrorhamnose 3,5-epimerase
MHIAPTELPEVLLITPKILRDTRGAFWETWNERAGAAAGLPGTWVQDNCSISKCNVVRGLHYQVVQPQGKLVRVTNGAVWDVAVDLRRSSANFGRHIGVELSAENGLMLYIPVGFGHGFAALTDNASLAYKVTDYYCPAGERTIVWNDTELGIPWPVSAENAIVSDKDQKGAVLGEAEVFA